MSTQEAGGVRAAGARATGVVGEAGASETRPSETSDAREEILARVRTALTDLTPEQREAEVPWTYGRATRTEGVLDLFAERVADYKADVVRVAAAEVPDAVARALTSRGAGSVVVPTGLDAAWREAITGAGVRIVEDEPRLTRAQLDEVDGVVTGACVGAAESGTIMLDHRPDQGRRALTLVPDLHVCVVRADQVVSDVPEAVARIAPSVREDKLPVTWISGGSATSDIELERVEGVHGPRTLVMILAEV